MKSYQADKIRDITAMAVNRINTEIGQVVLGVQMPFQVASKVAETLDATEKRV